MSSYWGVMADAVGNWPLQETAGTSGADMAGSHPAVLQAGLTFATGAVSGPVGWLPSALRFDGSTQLANIPSQMTLGLGASHAYAMWWKPYAAPPWSPQVMVETGGSTNGSLVQISDSHVKFVVTRNNTASHVSVSSATWGSWRHLVAVCKPTSLELYLDGALAGTASIPTTWSLSGSHTGAIGAVEGGRWVTGFLDTTRGCYFNGAIAGVTIFDRALTAAEAAELYQGPEPTCSSPPALASEIRAGATAAVTPGVWNSHSNGSLAVTGAVQISPDGVSGWEDVAVITEAESYLVPLGAVGRWVRVAASGVNLGGVSGAAYSTAIQVSPARTPGAAVAQGWAKPGALAGCASPSAGVEAGLVLSGPNP